MRSATADRAATTSIKHALVADDEKHTRVALALILRKAGYQVTAVEDGVQALGAIAGATRCRAQFDLLIIDVQMPGLTGLEVVEELVRIGTTAPTLLITGYRCPERVAELRRERCLECAEKPFSPEEFLDHVSRLLARSEREPAPRREPAPQGAVEDGADGRPRRA